MSEENGRMRLEDLVHGQEISLVQLREIALGCSIRRPGDTYSKADSFRKLTADELATEVLPDGFSNKVSINPNSGSVGYHSFCYKEGNFVYEGRATGS